MTECQSNCSSPSPPPAYDKAQVKLWYDRTGESLQPTIDMTNGIGKNNTRKFNAIVSFTGSMGPNITDFSLQSVAQISYTGEDQTQIGWKVQLVTQVIQILKVI